MKQDIEPIGRFISKVKLYSFVILFLCFGSIIIWSIQAEISSAIVSTGNLQLLEPPLTVKSKVNGQVQSIEIRNNQRVNKGDVLLRLNSEKERQQLELLSIEYKHWLELKDRVFPDNGIQLSQSNENNAANSEAKSESELKIEPSSIAQLNNDVTHQDRYRVSMKIASMNTSINHLVNVIKNKVITAPIDGVIYKLDSSLENQYISNSQQLMNILPNDNQLELSISVRAQERSKLFLTQPVRVVFSTLSSRDAPSLTATVSEISPVAHKVATSSDYYYAVKLTLKDVEKFEEKWKVNLVDGMQAEAFLSVGTTTPAKYLLKSVQQSLIRAWNE